MRESVRVFFRKANLFLLFLFLFGEVSENFDAIREAEIGNERNARDVVVAVFHLFVFDLDNALDATVRNVKVEVAFFDFVFHVSKIDWNFGEVKLFFDFF